MSDNLKYLPSADPEAVPVAADNIGGTRYQRVKVIVGEDGVNDGDVSALNPMPVSGPLTDAELRATALPVSGPLTDAQLRASAVPVSAAALPLPSGAATETTLAAISTKTPSLGQTTMAGSAPVVIASDQSNLSVIPAAAPLTSYSQAGVIAINTILVTLDCSQHRSISIQCVSMGTTGVVTPEWSNDNATWVAATLITAAGASATTFNAAGLWTLPVKARYLRLRLSTATTAGTTTLSIHRFEVVMPEFLATQPVSMATNTPTLAAGTNLAGDVGQQYRANATGAASYVSVLSPATPAVATVKASAGRLLGVVLQNSATAIRSVKFWNTLQAGVTLGTTAAVFEVDIPAGGAVSFNFEGGIGFATAITYAVTGAKGLTDNTGGLGANDVSGFIAFA